MRAIDPTSRHIPPWVLAGLAVVLAAVAVVAVWRPWSTPAATVAAGSGDTAVAVTPDLLDLPENPTVLIFGDSWTFGSAASDPALGYAYVVSDLTGWTTVVDGVRGSGYLKPGIDGPDFGTRIAALDPAIEPDLVIIQGSINDRRLPATGYAAAVDAAWDRLSATYPSARIVVLGPAPQVLPVQKATARIDRDLARLAGERGWWYLSPLREGWITEANYLDVIDTGIGRDHPSTAGHRYLAERLAEAVATISR
ncbi:SGNH/GDSL hydrolase family protein [uncultured Microbacterium sp.]|uniref:Putative GDSL-like Lipase/Acylhydrolase n=1 Tax=uncultured Microbacterium sp. TaxID=191216 RepID=A0A1Y5P715_9MICO|nr:SGNH/GDSL hydrolase family protein [uncultured Microbacterium sp.]SBS74502.1 putative GDSL-like Lipase/Acylhydrolase [uncultured Microbacterium sp.]